MKKIMNQPSDIVTEMVQGLVRSYPELLKQIPETEAVVYNQDLNCHPQVGLISGGGSGHEPAHAGFVGDGMLTAAVCGQVFTSPTPDQIYAAIKAADAGRGVFMIIKNYSGDVMNFEMAQEMAAMDDIEVRSIVVDDDIAVEDSTYTQGKRGVAGTILVHMILGAYARSGAELEAIERLAQQIVPNIKTIGVALSGATVPEVGKPGFELAPDEVEYGVGIHGEPGYRRETLQSAEQLATELVGQLKKAHHLTAGEHYAVMVNGLGATPLMEQYVFMNNVLDQLAAENVVVDFTKVGDYMTSLDMAGVSLTIMKLIEPGWVAKLDEPVTTIGW